MSILSTIVISCHLSSALPSPSLYFSFSLKVTFLELPALLSVSLLSVFAVLQIASVTRYLFSSKGRRLEVLHMLIELAIQSSSMLKFQELSLGELAAIDKFLGGPYQTRSMVKVLVLVRRLRQQSEQSSNISTRDTRQNFVLAFPSEETLDSCSRAKYSS